VLLWQQWQEDDNEVEVVQEELVRVVIGGWDGGGTGKLGSTSKVVATIARQE